MVTNNRYNSFDSYVSCLRRSPFSDHDACHCVHRIWDAVHSAMLDANGVASVPYCYYCDHSGPGRDWYPNNTDWCYCGGGSCALVMMTYLGVERGNGANALVENGMEVGEWVRRHWYRPVPPHWPDCHSWRCCDWGYQMGSRSNPSR